VPRLLVVDDLAEICAVIADFCTEQGYTVTTANDGASAMAALEHERFDILIVDIQLHGDSLALAKFARSNGTAVIVISGDPDSIRRHDGHGSYPFLQKPFRLTDLEAMLRDVIGTAP
jgi:DNA-binding response OmpR family regulator